eukprot:13844344-Alexandrium_andersonii.AAC.1
MCIRDRHSKPLQSVAKCCRRLQRVLHAYRCTFGAGRIRAFCWGNVAPDGGHDRARNNRLSSAAE